jgi:polyhydroxybutyrate depolymerase
MDQVADRLGFLVVYPNGSSGAFPNVRTFNAGGGTGGYACVSGVACLDHVNEAPYFDALLDSAAGAADIDRARVYATGVSDGAAMAHELACTLSGRLAAIAAVSGGNQYATTQRCKPAHPIPVLEIHGTQDAIWPYYGGRSSLAAAERGPLAGDFVSIPKTVKNWASRDDCTQSLPQTQLPIAHADGTSIVQQVFTRCRRGAEVVFDTVIGGGHGWPDGWRPSAREGVITSNLNANIAIWEFVSRYSLRGLA